GADRRRSRFSRHHVDAHQPLRRALPGRGHAAPRLRSSLCPLLRSRVGKNLGDPHPILSRRERGLPAVLEREALRRSARTGGGGGRGKCRYDFMASTYCLPSHDSARVLSALSTSCKKMHICTVKRGLYMVLCFHEPLYFRRSHPLKFSQGKGVWGRFSTISRRCGGRRAIAR